MQCVIRHIGLEVKDMKKMILYYEGLGFSKFWDKMEPPEHTGFKKLVRTVKLKDTEGNVLELTRNHPYKKHFALTVKYGKKPVTWISDPEGNMIEVVNEKLL